MGTRDRVVACHGILVDIHQATGGSCPAAFADVFQDGQGLVVGQSGVLEDGPLTFREASLADATVDHPNPPALPTEAAEDEISAASETGVGAGGILTTEAFDGRHDDRP